MMYTQYFRSCIGALQSKGSGFFARQPRARMTSYLRRSKIEFKPSVARPEHIRHDQHCSRSSAQLLHHHQLISAVVDHLDCDLTMLTCPEGCAGRPREV